MNESIPLVMSCPVRGLIAHPLSPSLITRIGARVNFDVVLSIACRTRPRAVKHYRN